MSNVRKALAVSAGVVALAVILSLTGVGSAVAEQARPLLVSIVNTAANPVPTREVAVGREPVAEGQRILGLNQEHATIYTVPEGKQLVIEMVTVSISLRSGLRPSANINLVSGGEGSQHAIATQPVATGEDGIVSYRGTHQVRFYADPGTRLTAFLGFSPSDPDWDNRVAAFSFSGYLVDAD